MDWNMHMFLIFQQKLNLSDANNIMINQAIIMKQASRKKDRENAIMKFELFNLFRKNL